MQSLAQPVRIPDLTFPYYDNPPPELLELLPDCPVALDVGRELRSPELAVALRGVSISASGMAVPEASVDEDSGSVFPQDDVGATWQVALIYAETIPSAVKKGTNCQLGLGVAVTDPRHIPAAMLLRYPVHD